MFKFIKIIIPLSLFLVLDCAGSRGVIKFNQLKHPTSMSSFLLNKDGKSLDTSKELKIIKNVKIIKTYWGIFFGFISFNNSNPFANKLNEEIKKANGYGVVDVKVRVDSCFINEVIIFNLLPVWPGCSIVTLDANIVKVVTK